MSRPPRDKIFYFCDETSHTVGDEFMAVGGIALNLSSLSDIERQICDLRDRLGLMGEIKWNNTKKRRDSGQKAYADLLRELVRSGNAHFHVRFQRTEDYDHTLSGSRRKTDTVSKAHYQLLTHRPIAFYGNKCDLHVRPDNGECTELLPNHIGHLNTESRKMHGPGNECVKSIHPTDSKASHPLQLLDVTLGAFACLRNERHKSGKLKTPKIELAEYVHGLWGNVDLTRSHRKTIRPFNVWNVKPKIKKARGS